MAAYLARRVIIAVPVLLGITFIAFVLLTLAPGDPLTARVDPSLLAQASPEWIAQQRHNFGLDQPLPVRYVKWLAGVAHGDLGYSAVTNRSIADELKVRLPATLQLMGAALLFGLLVGIPGGVLSAIKQYSVLDYILTALTMGLISVPSFFLGLLGIYLFGVYLHLLPTSGLSTLGAVPTLGDRLKHLILPASILGLGNAAVLMRYTRASMLDVLHRDYITTATAKGLRPWRILLRHAFRNALLPVITTVGLLLPELVAGAVITEQVFAWPGMGLMAVHAAADRDPAMLMGVVMVAGVGVVLSNLITDIAYAVSDPRIRY